MELNTVTITGRLTYAVTLTVSLATGEAEDVESTTGEEGEITYDYVGD